MKLEILVLALASLARVCKAKKGQTWFYQDKDCHITEEAKGDPTRLWVSGAYKTYSDVCYDDETGRQSFLMSKDLYGNQQPWTYCMQMSSGNQCSGTTIAMNVETKDQCYNITSQVGGEAFAMKSFRLEEGACGGLPPLLENQDDPSTCRYRSKTEL